MKTSEEIRFCGTVNAVDGRGKGIVLEPKIAGDTVTIVAECPGGFRDHEAPEPEPKPHPATHGPDIHELAEKHTGPLPSDCDHPKDENGVFCEKDDDPRMHTAYAALLRIEGKVDGLHTEIRWKARDLEALDRQATVRDEHDQRVIDAAVALAETGYSCGAWDELRLAVEARSNNTTSDARGHRA